MNVMDVSKAWFALISASGTTNNVSKRKHDFYRHSMIFITETSINFKTAKLLK